MSIQTMAQAAFAAIKAAVPSAVVAVVSGTETAQGIRDDTAADANLSVLGEDGMTTGIVRVSAADLTEPAKGATIKVAGDDVFVTGAQLDAAGALLAIRYSVQRPAGGI